MTNKICDGCETVAHCMKNGCVPKTTKKDEALKLALKALERGVATCFDQYAHEQVMSRPEHFVNQTITALREALAAPVQGWKLVPVEPTEDMWKAVNKLDDEMSAGSYDGKGCSIEQAWDCLLDASPSPPAQRTWVGLTDEERDDLLDNYITAEGRARAIEAKLKEKNT